MPACDPPPPRPTTTTNGGASPTNARGDVDLFRGMSKRAKRRARREMEKAEIERRLAIAKDELWSGPRPTDDMIRELLAGSPETVEYLRSFLRTPEG